MLVASKESAEVVKLLFDAGVDVNRTDKVCISFQIQLLKVCLGWKDCADVYCRERTRGSGKGSAGCRCYCEY